MPGRKRILFLHNSLDAGGAEKARLMLLKNIDRDRYDIRLCCIKNRGKIGEAIEGLGYKVDVLGLDPSPKKISTTIAIFKYLKKHDADILHMSLFNSNFHGRIAGAARRIPNIITEEHSEHYQYEGLRHIFYILSDFFLSGVTKFIICCSEAVRRDLIKKERLSPKKLITIQNCIDPSFYNVKEPRESVRSRYRISDDEVVFIAVGSLAVKKGHAYLLDALDGLKSDGFQFRCFLAGDGPLRESLKFKVKSLKLEDNVIFLGTVDNVEDYLNASDVFVLSSLKEGFSIALLEAMFMGLGCIVTDVGSNRELVKDYVNGIVVPSRDKDRLKEAMLFCLQHRNSLREFGLRSREMVEPNCLVGDYVRKFYDLWDSVNER